VVFLHSGVGSAGEWKQVISLWPEGYRLIAIDAYLWDVLFDGPLTLDALAGVTAPVHVIERARSLPGSPRRDRPRPWRPPLARRWVVAVG
jgi:hypothetical protein